VDRKSVCRKERERLRFAAQNAGQPLSKEADTAGGKTMFGYIVINQGEMKFKDYDIYHSYYCGLCRSLRKEAGKRGQVSLSYDMTLLVMTLSALYEPETKKQMCRCMAHPTRKHMERQNLYSDYSADMNLILTYYKCMDDWMDEKKKSRLFYAKTLKKTVQNLSERYPEKTRAIRRALKEIRQGEKQGEENPDTMAGHFGVVMGEIFAFQEDEWHDTLYRMGFYLGKFVYLLDAYEDIEKDQKEGNYNPFLTERAENFWQPVYGQPDFEEKCGQMLQMMMAECSRAFEQLPILKYGDILRNILYSGVWTRYEMVKQKRRNENRQEDKNEGSI
jgi:hypothetical protein